MPMVYTTMVQNNNIQTCASHKNNRLRQQTIEMYASTTKLAFISLLTSKLFSFNFVIHFTSIKCYTW